MRVAVIDTSCVIALDAVSLIPRTSVMFSRLLLPKAVRRELFRRKNMKKRIQRLFRDLHFLAACDEYDQGVVDVLLSERRRQGLKDRGEAEAVAQAGTVGATAIIDDPFGRKLAADYRLECHGTLLVFTELNRRGFLPGDELSRHLRQLARQGLRLAWPEANEFLISIGQPSLERS